MHSAFSYSQYFLRRQAIALTGKFRIYNQAGELVLFSQQKMFRLREDIRVYSDETQTQELLWIQARQVLDFSAAYDVIDSQSQIKVGALRRKGFRSMLQDEWDILDPGDTPTGYLKEDNMTRALLRRFLLGSLLPQDYDLVIQGQKVMDLKQRFNLFRYELDVDFSSGSGISLDRRLGIAAAILLATIEGKQTS